MLTGGAGKPPGVPVGCGLGPGGNWGLGGAGRWPGSIALGIGGPGLPSCPLTGGPCGGPDGLGGPIGLPGGTVLGT